MDLVTILAVNSTRRFRWLVKLGCWRLGIPIPAACHSAIVIRGDVYELTDRGIYKHPGRSFFDDMGYELIRARTFVTPYGALWIDRIRTLALAGTRLRYTDVLRLFLGITPQGLLCTSFVQAVMGLPLSPVPPTPDELIEQVINYERQHQS